MLARLAAQGLVEIGDEVKERKRPPSIAVAVLVAERRRLGAAGARGRAARAGWPSSARTAGGRSRRGAERGRARRI